MAHSEWKNAGVEVINLGSGTTFDLTKYPNYKNLTKSNFLINILSISNSIHLMSNSYGNSSVNVSNYLNYNATTGRLAVNIPNATAYNGTTVKVDYNNQLSTMYHFYACSAASISYNVYLIY